MWFTETPWPPIVILVVAAVVCGWMWLGRRQSWLLVGIIVCMALSVGVLVFEQSIVTPAEQIEQHILDMADAFQARDRDELLSFISVRAQDVRNRISWGLATVTRVESLRITDVQVAMLAQGTRARSRFRANGTIEVVGFGDIGHQPTLWQMTWQQEGGLWKVIEVQRLDPITGEQMGFGQGRR